MRCLYFGLLLIISGSAVDGQFGAVLDFCSQRTDVDPQGQIGSPNYPQSFNPQTACTSQGNGVIIPTRGYQSATIILDNTQRSLDNTTAAGCILQLGNSSRSICSLPSLAAGQKIYISNIITKDIDLQLTLNTNSATAASFLVEYQLTNKLCDTSYSRPLYLPTTVEALASARTCTKTLNVYGYNSLSIELAGSIPPSSDCSTCSISVGPRDGSKQTFCTNGTYTVDVRAVDEVTLSSSCQDSGSAGTNFIQAAIRGTEGLGFIHLCSDAQGSFQTRQGQIISPGYPQPITENFMCKVGITGYDLIDIRIRITGPSPSYNTELNLGGTVFSFAENRSVSNMKTNGQTFWISLNNTGQNSRLPPFYIEFQAKRVDDICSAGVKSSSVDVASLPYYLSSPGFPDSYPTFKRCSTTIIIPEEYTSAMVYLDIELESPPGCIHDYLTLGTSNQQLCHESSNRSLSSVLTGTRTVPVFFRSDNAYTSRGFILTIDDPNKTTASPTTAPTTTPATTPATPSATSTVTTITVPPTTEVAGKSTTIQTSSQKQPESTISTKTPTAKSATGTTKVDTSVITGKDGKMSNQSDKSSGNGFSVPGYIIGIICGCVVLLAGVSAALIFMLIKRRRSKLDIAERSNYTIGFENPSYGAPTS